MRPSQMPNAAGHSIGNANVVKANVLFEFLRGSVLPALMRKDSGTITHGSIPPGAQR
jgi:hypothetical protein